MTFQTSRNHSVIVVVFLLAIFFSLESKAENEAVKILTQEKALQSAQTPSDSIKILLDIYNLSDKVKRDVVRVQILDLSQRSDSQDVINSVLRELSTSTDDAKELAALLELSQSLPDSGRRETMETVIQMETAKSEASNVADSDVHREVMEYARQGYGLNGDPYKEIQNIYRAMTFLGASSQGPLFFEYMKRLEELVSQLPQKDHAIKNLFYTTAALFYTRKRDFKKAIHFDNLLIKELDGMNEFYKKKGDNSHNLNYFYFLSYRRMLRNFKGLSPEEVEYYYQKCLELAKIDEKVAESIGNGGLTNSYYYMAKNQYAKAIPELKKALNSDEISKYRRRELLGLLAAAYRETGNYEGELETLRPYITLLQEDREELIQDMYKEIELRNSTAKLINDQYLARERQRQENSVMRKTSLTLVYVLGIILIFLFGAYMRLRSKIKEVEYKNNRLHKNIQHIFDDGVPTGTQNLRLHRNRLKG